MWSVVNSIAWYYHSTQALQFTVVLQLFLLWLFGTLAWLLLLLLAGLFLWFA